MNPTEILKQIDDLIVETDSMLGLCFSNDSRLRLLEDFYYKNLEIMENYEKVLEIEHFKQTEL